METTWYNTGFKSTVDGSFGKTHTHTHNVTKFTHGVREKVREIVREIDLEISLSSIIILLSYIYLRHSLFISEPQLLTP